LIKKDIYVVGVPKPKTVTAYEDENGKEPFNDWVNNLADQEGRRAILRRTARLDLGLYGDCKPVGNGVSELRFSLGPGYRVYFGRRGDHIVLLCGGDKDSQARDIKVAQDYWEDHKKNGTKKKK
jgi:putative addiction module killer protein